jgi:MtN3 and saliva related transmembrane protein
MFETSIGLFAALCTTASYLPQVVKCWRTRETQDLSLKMLVLLGFGLAGWIVYGSVKGDWVIIVSNVISLILLANVLGFKLLEVYSVKASSAGS